MHTPRFVDFSIPQAQNLADLTGIDDDLHAVQRLCDRILKMDLKPSTEEDAELPAALCAAALVRYGRTFSGGVRARVTDANIAGLDHALQDWHVLFKDLRDKWIAHSVNAYEENYVVAYLMPPEEGPPEVEHVAVHSRRVLILSKVAISALHKLADSLRQIVISEISSERALLLEYARSIPSETLYMQTLAELPGPPENSQAGKRRRPFSNAWIPA